MSKNLWVNTKSATVFPYPYVTSYALDGVRSISQNPWGHCRVVAPANERWTYGLGKKYTFALLSHWNMEVVCYCSLRSLSWLMQEGTQMFPMLACVRPWERQLLQCTGPRANRHMGWGRSGHDWMEVKGTQAVSSRVCMEPHILTDIKTTKNIYYSSGMVQNLLAQFQGSLTGGLRDLETSNV